MQQIEVDVVESHALKRCAEVALRLLRMGTRPCQALRRHRIRITRIALDQRLAERLLGRAFVVDESGIEVRSATLDERIHHLRKLLEVDALLVVRVEQRQPHAPETQLRYVLKI